MVAVTCSATSQHPSLSKKVTQETNMLVKHPLHIPVICVKIHEPLEAVKHGKLLMQRSMTGAQVKETLKSRLPFTQTAHFLVGGLHVPDNIMLSELHEKHRAENGFLYVTICDRENMATPSQQVLVGRVDSNFWRTVATTSHGTGRKSKDHTVMHLLTKYPNHVPIICRQFASHDLPGIEKKLLLPLEMTVSKVRGVIAQRLPKSTLVDPERIVIIVGRTIPKENVTINELYDCHHNDAGILYVSLALDLLATGVDEDPRTPSAWENDEALCSLVADEALNVAPAQLAAEAKHAVAADEELTAASAEQKDEQALAVAAEAAPAKFCKDVLSRVNLMSGAETACAQLGDEITSQQNWPAVAEVFRARFQEEVASLEKRVVAADALRAQMEEEIASLERRAAAADALREQMAEEVKSHELRAATAEAVRSQLEEEVACQTKRAAVAEAARAQLAEEVAPHANRADVAEAAGAQLAEEVASQANRTDVAEASRGQLAEVPRAELSDVAEAAQTPWAQKESLSTAPAELEDTFASALTLRGDGDTAEAAEETVRRSVGEARTGAAKARAAALRAEAAERSLQAAEARIAQEASARREAEARISALEKLLFDKADEGVPKSTTREDMSQQGADSADGSVDATADIAVDTEDESQGFFPIEIVDAHEATEDNFCYP
eukprot:TRINITY_DN5887_c0_g3_i1.p1 TRINITY_DN5887_c0_g3~~TRINITY_DN5887_c0_g3_i1.p1  ORF type:complete len:670 (-),score=154.64 TRINITY_DN5887_c0_g3_i1:333-2342(-)